MPLLLDTSTVAPEHRQEAWAHVHAQALFPLSIGFADGTSFNGRSESHDLGSMALLRVRGDACTVRRTPRTIRAADPEHLVVALALDGSCPVEQAGRHAVLSRGDMTTWDSSRPFHVPHERRFDLLLLSAPMHELGVRRRDTARQTPGASGTGAIAGAFLRQLWRQVDEGAVAQDNADLQDALVAIVRAVHGSATDSVLTAPGITLRTLPPRVRAYAMRHLGDPQLGPPALALAHHVSVRQLHVAFRHEDDTIAAWIRHERLERCLHDLRDPALADVPIARIAAHWGMTNHAHFTRAFRAAYGLTPREARASALATPRKTENFRASRTDSTRG